jgi:hypothetical protein
MQERKALVSIFSDTFSVCSAPEEGLLTATGASGAICAMPRPSSSMTALTIASSCVSDRGIDCLRQGGRHIAKVLQQNLCLVAVLRHRVVHGVADRLLHSMHMNGHGRGSRDESVERPASVQLARSPAQTPP